MSGPATTLRARAALPWSIGVYLAVNASSAVPASSTWSLLAAAGLIGLALAAMGRLRG